jgi:hypothetical protein
MKDNDLTPNAKLILEETGGDRNLADLFIECQQRKAAELGGYIPQWQIDLFYKEVEKIRKKREDRYL